VAALKARDEDPGEGDRRLSACAGRPICDDTRADRSRAVAAPGSRPSRTAARSLLRVGHEHVCAPWCLGERPNDRSGSLCVWPPDSEAHPVMNDPASSVRGREWGPAIGAPVDETTGWRGTTTVSVAERAKRGGNTRVGCGLLMRLVWNEHCTNRERTASIESRLANGPRQIATCQQWGTRQQWTGEAWIPLSEDSQSTRL
jgi:hypothetical protein